MLIKDILSESQSEMVSSTFPQVQFNSGSSQASDSVNKNSSNFPKNKWIRGRVKLATRLSKTVVRPHEQLNSRSSQASDSGNKNSSMNMGFHPCVPP